jgi:hypothetical protein
MFTCETPVKACGGVACGRGAGELLLKESRAVFLEADDVLTPLGIMADTVRPENLEVLFHIPQVHACFSSSSWQLALVVGSNSSFLAMASRRRHGLLEQPEVVLVRLQFLLVLSLVVDLIVTYNGEPAAVWPTREARRSSRLKALIVACHGEPPAVLNFSSSPSPSVMPTAEPPAVWPSRASQHPLPSLRSSSPAGVLFSSPH